MVITDMRSDWKKIFCIIVIIIASNCAWVVRTKEKLDRPPLDLTPLSDSLLVLPDSGSGEHDEIVLFHTHKHSSYDYLYPILTSQPILTYAIGCDGFFNIIFFKGEESKSCDIGYISRSAIQELVFDLNNIGFFRADEERSPYKYIDIEKTYLFGIVIKNKQYTQKFSPSSVIKSVYIHLRNFTYKTEYRGFNDDAEKYGDGEALQILKNGFEIIEAFFEDNLRKFDEN